MKLKKIALLTLISLIGLSMFVIFAEEQVGNNQETTTMSEALEENTEQTTVSPLLNRPFHEDIVQAVLEQGYQVNDYYRPESAIVIDSESGAIIFGDHIDQVWDPASISKVMAAYFVMQAIKDGKLSLDTKITATDNDQAISNIEDISNNQIVSGVEYPVEDLLYLMMYPSSNVATVMLARAVSETDGQFVDKMNEKAQEWGMKNTRFYNASGAATITFRGLYNPEGYDSTSPNQTTARDLAILAYHLLKEFPDFLNFTKYPAITVMENTPYEETFYTLNYSIPGMVQGFTGVDGFKTGSSGTAAFNHLVTAKQGNTRLIEVILGVGSWTDGDSGYFRNEFGNGLLKKAFSEYETKRLLKAGEHVIDDVKLVVHHDILVTVARDEELPKVTLDKDKANLIIEQNLPMLTSSDSWLTVPVKIIPEETTTQIKQETTAEGVTEANLMDFDDYLRSLEKKPWLLALSIFISSAFISGIIVGIVYLIRKTY